ncbi:MAG: hypothetical protein ACKV19_24520, partial [Verrucomicrobiales bacterium]
PSGHGPHFSSDGRVIHTRRISIYRVFARRSLWLWAPLEKAKGAFIHHAPTAYEPGRSRPTSSLKRPLKLGFK